MEENVFREHRVSEDAVTVKQGIRTRLLASLIHLTGSALVAGVAAYLVFGIWYPSPFSAISGGIELFYLLVGVDVAVGPLLTFAVFDRRKPRVELRRDLLIIVVLQLLAMAYGLHTMAIARPVVLALETDRFRVVTAQAVLEQELSQAPAGLQTISWSGPRILNTRVPSSAEKADAVMMALAGADLGMRPSFWLPWDQSAREAARRAATPAEQLAQRGQVEADALRKAAGRIGRTLGDLACLPILGRRTDWVVLLDRRTGDVLGYAPVNGF